MISPFTSGARRGALYVVSGPSGVGKGTLLDRLISDVADVARSVSATTRLPRPGEIDGVHYHFLSEADFDKGIGTGVFFEFARYNGSLYGTPRDKVEEQRAEGLDVVLEIEVQGAMIVKQLDPTAILIYIQPPSSVELERRLRRRHTETEETIQRRLAIAAHEQTYIPEYTYLITNDALERAAETLQAVVVAERHRVRR